MKHTEIRCPGLSTIWDMQAYSPENLRAKSQGRPTWGQDPRDGTSRKQLHHAVIHRHQGADLVKLKRLVGTVKRQDQTTTVPLSGGCITKCWGHLWSFSGTTLSENQDCLVTTFSETETDKLSWACTEKCEKAIVSLLLQYLIYSLLDGTHDAPFPD